MTKKLFIGLFLVCFVLVPIVYLKADSGRESKQLPPQEVEIMYSSEDHAYQMKDINDVVRWKILPDGTMATINASGVTVSGINGADGKPILRKDSYINVPMSGLSIYTLTTAYNVYIFDLVQTDQADLQINGMNGLTDNSANGVSVFMPTGTAALDGWTVEIHNITASGTTDIILVPANDVFASAGITDYIMDLTGTTGTPGSADRSAYTYDVNDAQWEMIKYVYRYAVAGGTWYQVDQK